MRTKLATTAFKMPFLGISLPLSASPEFLTEASLYLTKGLLLPDLNVFGQRFHKNSSIQDAISLCLDKLYQPVCTAAKSSDGLSRLFFYKKLKYKALIGHKMSDEV